MEDHRHVIEIFMLGFQPEDSIEKDTIEKLTSVEGGSGIAIFKIAARADPSLEARLLVGSSSDPYDSDQSLSACEGNTAFKTLLR